MGYSCTSAALRTLQAIKETCGADLTASNEVLLYKRKRLAFFERGTEQDDGAIVGEVFDNFGRLGEFRINPDGTIHHFPGLLTFDRRKVEWIVKQPDYTPRVQGVI
jgi:hypothetical protein